MMRIGPGGTAGLGYEEGLKEINRLKLDSLEVEFTYGVRMTNEEAQGVGKIAKKLGVRLSIHAPYYINLASKEKPKVHASKTRILQSCERAHHMGATHVVFHAGFYQGRDKEEIYQIIKKEIEDLLKTIKQKKWKVILALETTGKASQFGDLDELLKMSKETRCGICVDFSHLKARSNGKIEYREIIEKIKGLKHVHAHFSGIEFGEKGERRHLLTPEKEIKELVGLLVKNKIDITLINESPDPIGDSAKTKRILSQSSA